MKNVEKNEDVKAKKGTSSNKDENWYQRVIHYSVDENTILHFLLQYWIPGVVSFLIGGVLISVLMPYIQADFETERFNQQRRKELTEQIAEGFGPYLTNWRRLREVTVAQNTLEPDSQIPGKRQKTGEHATSKTGMRQKISYMPRWKGQEFTSAQMS